jgi:hypothetical protein
MDIYIYRQGVYDPTTARDLSGFDVEATDGGIGKVDEATNETSSSTLVVDTGFWIFGKKRMIPAGVVRRVDADEKKIYVSMTKDQIKNAPDYDPDRHSDETYRRNVGDYYEPYSN